MDHPDKSVNISWAHAGEVQNLPEQVISVVVTDEENEPAGLLEKWGADAWIYADADSLMAGEPEPPDDESY